MKYPFFIIAVILILGICIGNVIDLAFPMLILFGFLFTALSLMSINKKVAGALCLFVLILFSGIILVKAHQNLGPRHIANLTTEEKQHILIKGIVVTQPYERITFNNIKKTTFVLKPKNIKTEGLEWQDARGLVIVEKYGKKSAAEYGDLLFLEGSLHQVKGPKEPGRFDYKEYLKRRQVYSILDAVNIKVLEKNKANALISLALKAKNWAKEKIERFVQEPESLLVNGIILGERKAIPKELNQAFINTGTVHILAISGLNVSLVLFIFLLLFRIMRIPKRINIFLAILFLSFYCLLTGAQVPVIRATIMAIVLLLGKLINREADLINLLGLSAVVILIFAPLAVFDASFILSYASVLAILLMLPLVERYKRNFLMETLIVSFGIWAGIWPIVAHYFDIITFSTILANLVIVPLSFILTGLGFLLLFCSLFSASLANIIGASTWFCAKVLIASVIMFSKIPFSYIKIKGPNLWQMAVYYAVLITIAVIFRHLKAHSSQPKAHSPY